MTVTSKVTVMYSLLSVKSSTILVEINIFLLYTHY